MVTHHKTVLHYLELLNTIASGERRTGIFLQAWADTTPDPALRVCLSMVAQPRDEPLPRVQASHR